MTLPAALAAGLTPETVRHRLRSGEWTRLGCGAFLTARDPPTWLDTAVAAVLTTGGALSYTSAARLHGFDVCPPTDRLHVTVPRLAGRHQHRPDLRVHFHDLGPDETGSRGGLVVTSPLRTALDCARLLRPPAAAAALECATRRGGVAWPDVAAAAAGHHSLRVRAAARLADPGSGSALETELRLLLVGRGLPPPAVQVDVGRYRVDLAYPQARLAIEMDRRAYHSGPVDFARDRARQNELVLRGWTVLRFTAADLRRPGAVVAAVRAVLARAA